MTSPRLITLLATAAAILPLGACKTSSLNPLEAAKPTHERIEGRFIDSPAVKAVVAAPLSADKPRRINLPTDPTAVKAFSGKPDVAAQGAFLEATGVVEDSALTAYLDRVMADLLRGWPGAKPAISIFVRTTDTFQPHAQSGNDVFLSVGTLANLENEHQLAAVLAHEAGHILLRHFDRDDVIKAQKQLISAGASMVILGAVAKDTRVTPNGTGGVGLMSLNKASNQNLMSKAAIAGLLLTEVTDTLIDKAWSREDESEADLIAIDLMVKAKYDPAAYQEVLAKLEKLRQEQQTRAAALEAGYNAAMQEMAARGDFAGMFGALPGMAVSIGTSALLDLRDKQREQHLAPEVRGVNIASYVDREYDDRDRRAIARRPDQYSKVVNGSPSKTILANHADAIRAKRMLEHGDLAEAERLARKGIGGPTATSAHPQYVMALVKRQQGRSDEALRHTAIAAQSPLAPSVVYTDLAVQYAERNRTSDALKALETGSWRLGGEERFLPAYIQVYRMGQMEKEAAEAYGRCKTSESTVLREQCAGVAGDKNGGKKPSLLNLFGT